MGLQEKQEACLLQISNKHEVPNFRRTRKRSGRNFQGKSGLK